MKCSICGKEIQVLGRSLKVNGKAFHKGCYFMHCQTICPECGHRDRVYKGTLYAFETYVCVHCGALLSTQELIKKYKKTKGGVSHAKRQRV